MVRDNISSTKWYWDLDPWRTGLQQLRLRVENGRWTDIILRDGVLDRDENGMRLPDEYPELYSEFALSMLNTEYLTSAEGVSYTSGDGPEPEAAFAPPTTGEIAQSHGEISEKTAKTIQKWLKRGTTIAVLAVTAFWLKDVPWSQVIDWYMENFGNGMPVP